MKRVLLTGASGFIGSNVLKYLLKETNWTFICPVSLRHRGSGEKVPQNNRVTVIYHDLRGNMPPIGKCDFILHLASESHVDRSIQRPVEFIENNVQSTLQVLEYARRSKPERFVLFSTDEVYGPHEHKEWDVLLPSNPYAASKACQEMIAFSYWRTYGVPVVITNSNNVVGPGQHPEKFIPKVIGLINEGKPVTVHQTEAGPGIRHYNPVQNVADALLYILTHDWLRLYTDRPLRFELPGGEEMDNYDMVQLISKLMNKPVEVVRKDGRIDRPGYDQCYAPTHGDLPMWKPVITLEECLKEIINA